MNLSLRQWRRAFDRQLSFFHSLSLCGRLLLLEPNRLVLGDASGTVTIDWPAESLALPHPQYGDWVRVTFFSESCQQTIDSSRIELLEPPQIEVIQRAFKEPRIEDRAPFLRQRQYIISQIRRGLEAFGLEEVETPTLVPCPGIEPTIEPFQTDWKNGSKLQKLALPTSPELHLKRLMVRGWTDIFEFKTCFRNNELSEHHQPEFLMLEWYRAFQNLSHFAEDLQVLLSDWVVAGQRPLNLARRSMASLFDEFLGERLTPSTSQGELREWVERRGGSPSLKHQDDLFQWLFVTKIEPNLAPLGPLLIDGFMPWQKALARVTEEGWADRVEFYWGGLEIANAFHEETNPGQLKTQFTSDQKARTALLGCEYASDEEFLLLAEQGLPPAYGVALGVDRLVMAVLGLNDIGQVRFFSKV